MEKRGCTKLGGVKYKIIMGLIDKGIIIEKKVYKDVDEVYKELLNLFTFYVNHQVSYPNIYSSHNQEVSIADIDMNNLNILRIGVQSYYGHDLRSFYFLIEFGNNPKKPIINLPFDYTISDINFSAYDRILYPIELSKIEYEINPYYFESVVNYSIQNPINISFNKAQEIMNNCILDDYHILVNAENLRSEFLTTEQKRENLKECILEISKKRGNLFESIPIIQSIINWTENKEFLWESSFVESLTIEEKKKYINFDNGSFDYKKYTKQSDFYDKELPFFSSIVQFIVWSKYLKYLNDKHKSLLIESNIEPSTISSLIKKTFGSNFTDKQIDILTKCANEATIFAQSISKETMKSIFACNLETPLQLTNNRLLAYFFNALLMKELIRYDWQDISGENKLFSSKNGNLIKRGDLSTAKNQCLENPPKESEIIDKYINQL